MWPDTYSLAEMMYKLTMIRCICLQALTGPQLLLVDDQALFAFGVESEFRRQTILQAVVELKTLDYSTPKNFQQFKVVGVCTNPP